MKVKGKVIEESDEHFVLQMQFGSNSLDNVDFSDILEDFDGKDIIITINVLENRNIDVKKATTNGGNLEWIKC